MEQTTFDLSSEKEGKGVNEPGLAQAYAEVYQIILHMEDDLRILIPRTFLLFLRKNMDTHWGRNLDFSKTINQMDLLQKTRVILSLVYRDFICSPEERKELIQKDKREAILGGWEYKSFSLTELF